MTTRLRICLGMVLVILATCPTIGWSQPPRREVPITEIRFLDSETGEGIPLIEAISVNSLRWVSDNAGRIAIQEPGWDGQERFFQLRTHGYEIPKDGFGIAGIRVTLKATTPAIVKLRRVNLAERLCRLTGEGLWRDSWMLGYPVPRIDPQPRGLVAGQDSIQTALYRGKIRWFWGDTSRLSYPLGLFRMAGAVSDPPGDSVDLRNGIDYQVFTDTNGFARAMMPLPERPEGVIWLDGYVVVPDAEGKDVLIAHYSRRKGLAEELEHGIARYADATDRFEVIQTRPLTDTWRVPHGHPIIHEIDGKKWLYCGNGGLNVRVPATLSAILDASQYQAFRREGNQWSWQSKQPPTQSADDLAALKAGTLSDSAAYYAPRDVENPDQRIQLHHGSVRWNPARKRFVMVITQIMGKPSMLGEIWYSESDQPNGPFRHAIRILTHDRQTFYNPCHHDFLDRDGGQVIHFEGTYTSDFSGNPEKTARYDYNQMLYRLDLRSKRMASLLQRMDKVTDPKQ
ncbi:hypothetical protein [Tuwongella immobilis]|uniref:Uncharacterized protein n=1 Tax=Tuwongella immobilis TaxID=692036 RepID=A0A6C2YQE4_9BACT|nr:hypothetical protein [Tuwongella immobilis]VIP03389.1 Uncharacterized protein OS=Chthoniobacter flavus Ellin428 GN=CfE428DRAFT_3504 PE=4 SV=1 [Tuwongella immobilis]VTS04150.1 Uncharacterized protein OS=Chthoniobacter flavus Ellin428 GN=CfE428DRAFT_3504 PE=4 SV=1 [Tuwongella immobilis]